MWQYNYSNELHHHGVKGMKWGVRKAITRYKQDKAGHERYKQFMKDYNGGKVKKYKPKKGDVRYDEEGWYSDRDILMTTLDHMPKVKADWKLEQSYQARVGKAAVGASLGVLAGVTIAMFKNGGK